MATTNQSNIKISTLAKELKMKSGKELIEKLAALGFADIKSTSSSIAPDAFNKLFESIRASYTEDGVDVDDYVSGKVVIAEFAVKKEAPEKKTEKVEEKVAKPEVKTETKPAEAAKKQPAAPKTEDKKPIEEKKPVEAKKPVEEKKVEKPLIEYDDFDKLDLAVGKIIEAKKHPKADKLLVFKVDLGTEVRQIVSGIAAFYNPDDLVGKKVVVVKNLKPIKLRGEESHGMLLCASDINDEVLELLNVASCKPGDIVR